MVRPFQPLGTPAHRPRPARERSPWQNVAILVVVACFALYAWQAVTAGEPVGGGLLLMPMLFLVTAPVLVGARRSEPTFDLAGLMATGLALRCVGAYFRWANGPTPTSITEWAPSSRTASARWTSPWTPDDRYRARVAFATSRAW